VAAPRIGQHTAEVLADWLGRAESQAAVAGDAPSHQVAATTAGESTPVAPVVPRPTDPRAGAGTWSHANAASPPSAVAAARTVDPTDFRDKAHATERLNACYAHDRRRELVRGFLSALRRHLDETGPGQLRNGARTT